MGFQHLLLDSSFLVDADTTNLMSFLAMTKRVRTPWEVETLILMLSAKCEHASSEELYPPYSGKPKITQQRERVAAAFANM